MDKFLIRGGKALRGKVAISGAKNSALPVMAAALLTAEKVLLHNIPKVRDLITMSKLLTFMDAKVSVTEVPASDYVIEAPKLNHAEAPYELVKTMRASILTLGPLMARLGVARVSSAGRMRDWGAPSGFALEGAGAEWARRLRHRTDISRRKCRGTVRKAGGLKVRTFVSKRLP